MNELTVVELEGKEYSIIDEIQVDNIIYVYFINPKNLTDFCIRKTVDEKKEILTGLDDVQEFNKALKIFEQKNMETFK